MTNTSGSKGSETMKFVQLIEYNMGNVFLWKIEHISGSIVYIFIQFVFIVCQVEDYRNILKLSYRPLVLTWDKAFF